MTESSGTHWRRKVIDPSRVLEAIEPGMTIYPGIGVAQRRGLIRELMVPRADNLQDLTLIQRLSLGDLITAFDEAPSVRRGIQYTRAAVE